MSLVREQRLHGKLPRLNLISMIQTYVCFLIDTMWTCASLFGSRAKLHLSQWAVRDTLEQIDVTKRFVSEYSDTFQLCTTPSCARSAFKAGKIASMIGIEGGHQTGNSLGALRLMFDMGARYITLTHNCDNAFGTAWTTVDSGKEDKGLTLFGQEYVREMNRLGMLIDLAHVSHNTMRDVLNITRAPVIFSHSGAYSVEPHLRHAPDDVLRSMKRNGGVVMVPFVTWFLNMKHPENATVENVVDHIMRIAELAGWEYVGIGSDFDGTVDVPKGLEVGALCYICLLDKDLTSDMPLMLLTGRLSISQSHRGSSSPRCNG